MKSGEINIVPEIDKCVAEKDTVRLKELLNLFIKTSPDPMMISLGQAEALLKLAIHKAQVRDKLGCQAVMNEVRLKIIQSLDRTVSQIFQDWIDERCTEKLPTVIELLINRLRIPPNIIVTQFLLAIEGHRHEKMLQKNFQAGARQVAPEQFPPEIYQKAYQQVGETNWQKTETFMKQEVA